MTDLPPLTRYAALAASARAQVRPHRIAQPPVQAAELAHRLLHAPVDERRKELEELDDRALLDVLVVMELYTGSAYGLWRDTPSGFAEDVLGMTLTEEQRAVVDAVAGVDVRQVAARVPHPDNHVLAAVLVVWTALVPSPRPYGDCPRFAALFAPYRQAAESVWRHVARFVDNALLPGRLNTARHAWYVDGIEGPQRILAFAVWNTQPHAMGGLYQFVAVVADADRIADPDMRATMNFLVNSVSAGSRFVALGSDDDEPEEWFAAFETRDDVTRPVTSASHERT
ncbi:hypothetical protein ABZ468_08225 [Streptomyces sp. NPDC005708]|uniref:hypothetical protein n=1 Tax=Streptomyces sp. NPDC005708 TaxID=3154564 RepID=UPI0034029A3B